MIDYQLFLGSVCIKLTLLVDFQDTTVALLSLVAVILSCWLAANSNFIIFRAG